jgi:cobalt-zinc-cadmium efflux system outer membrane protein
MPFFLRGRRNRAAAALCVLMLLVSLAPPRAVFCADETVVLDDLIAEGLRNSPEILAAQARAEAAGYRIPQAKSLPDPMFMFGYQNEGFQSLTIGRPDNPNAMGMSSLSQQFYFPGKRALKGEMAARDAESLAAISDAAKHRVAAQIKLLFYDLFLSHKTLDILKDRSELFSRIEDAAQGRYASGTGMQQEVIMAQTEKYMILEKEEMQRQRMQALQGMLNTTVGRRADAPLGRPVQPAPTPYGATLEEMLRMAADHSPEVRSKKKMVEGAEAKVKMAKKEYYPDYAVGASYFPRTMGLPDMWNLTVTVNLPIYQKTKQRQAEAEAEAGLSEARRELAATELMLASNVRESFSMVQAADRLMKLYKEGLIPKTNQDVQLAFSSYVTGKVDALTVITRIKNLLDYDLLYWNQLVEREKAIARLHAFAGVEEMAQGIGQAPAGKPAQGEAR